MSVGAAVKQNSERVPYEKEIAALEEVFGSSFELWARVKLADWELDSSFGKTSIADDDCDEVVKSLLELCDSGEVPQSVELASDRQLPAVPFDGRCKDQSHCAIVENNSNSPDLLVPLALIKLRELENEADLVQLREENRFFLKQVSVVRTLVSAIESKDDYTCGHSERVARYGKRLAKEVGYDQEACERLYLTGLLHDVGKIGVSDAVLKKEGALTTEEFAEIQKHPELGWAILRELEHLDYVLPGVLHHHEREDGKGYPDQLGGDEIPRDGQLLAVVDAFDAMTSDRPYRKGMSVKKAVEIFKEGAGTQWNAALVEDFLKILPDILAIKDNYCRPPVPIREKGIPRSGVVIADSRTANCQPV